MLTRTYMNALLGPTTSALPSPITPKVRTMLTKMANSGH